MKRIVSGGVFALSLLCSLGNVFIDLPLAGSDASDILGAAFAIALSVLAVLFIYRPLTSYLSCENRGPAKKAFTAVLNCLLLAGLLLTAVFTVCELSEYTCRAVLPGASRGAVFLLVFVTAVIIAAKGTTTISKTALVFAAATLLFIVLIFAFSVSQMDLRYLDFSQSIGAVGIAKSSFAVFLRGSFPSLIIMTAMSYSVKDDKGMLWGAIAGGSCILLAMLTCVLVFGGGLASTLPYSYTAAVRIVGSGDIFSGMEGFLFAAVWFSCIMKTVAALYGIKVAAKSLISLKNEINPYLLLKNLHICGNIII